MRKPGAVIGRGIARDERAETDLYAFISKRHEQRVVVEGEAGRRRGMEGLRTPSGGPQAHDSLPSVGTTSTRRSYLTGLFSDLSQLPLVKSFERIT